MTQQKNSEFEREPNIRLSPRYFEAVAYASGLHAGQTRKGTTIPYMSHLLGVSSLVLEALGDEDQAIAALLHDAAEDCGGEPRLQEIDAMFGPRVASIVRGCSDSLVQDPKNKLDWRKRKEDYIKHLGDADFDVILVSCADKLHNARAIWTDIQRDGAETMWRFNASGLQTAWYYSELLGVFTWRRAPEDLLIPLRDVVFDVVRVLENPPLRQLFRRRSSHRREPVPGQRMLPLADDTPTSKTEMTAASHAGNSTWDKLENLREQLDFNDSGGSASIETVEHIYRMLPKSRVELREYRDDAWEIVVSFNVTTPLAVFRSDGTFQASPDWGMTSWSDFKEGGPDNVASLIIRDFGRALGDQAIERKWGRLARNR